MESGAYVEMNIISILMCFAVWYQQKRKDSPIIGDRSFNWINWIIVVMLVLDILSWSMQEHIISHKYWMHMLVLCGYYIGQTLLTLQLLKYCIHANDQKIKKWQHILLFIPMFLVIIGVVVNIYKPFAFKLIENKQYNLLSGILYLEIWPLFYIVLAMIVAIIHYVHTTDKETAKHLLIFISIAILGGIIGTLVYGLSLWPILAFDLEYLYLNVQSKREKDMDVLAFHDPLTGLKNATAYRYTLNQLDKKIENRSVDFAVVVMDINGLKGINDKYGHEMGNQLIVSAAKFMCDIFGKEAVFRIGGDEFVAILEKENYNIKDRLIEKFDREIEHAELICGETKFPISIARGMAEYHREDEMFYSDVFQAADCAMYQNKVWIKSMFPI